MNNILKNVYLFFALFAISSCNSDVEKYFELIGEAVNSPVTELVTPDSLNFSMNEDEYNSYIDNIPHKYIDDETYWLFHIEDEVYAISFSGTNFYEEKLCRYGRCIDGRIVNDSLRNLYPNDINKIVEHYKTALGDECKLAIWDDKYLLAKGNLTITVNRSGKIWIVCENRPVSIKIEEEKRDNESSDIPTATVKNNKWNGGVKQVEDYLERTLRDPDSYESIEWSEVKQKDDGYYVRHKYRAKNGFGGYVVANQLFHLDFSGNVVDVKDLY